MNAARNMDLDKPQPRFIAKRGFAYQVPAFSGLPAAAS